MLENFPLSKRQHAHHQDLRQGVTWENLSKRSSLQTSSTHLSAIRISLQLSSKWEARIKCKMSNDSRRTMQICLWAHWIAQKWHLKAEAFELLKTWAGLLNMYYRRLDSRRDLQMLPKVTMKKWISLRASRPGSHLLKHQRLSHRSVPPGSHNLIRKTDHLN